MTNETNDITSLGTVKLNENKNNISSVNISKGENTGINFGYAPNKTQQDKIETQISKLQQDTEKTRETALQDILAGNPQIESPTINISKTNVNDSSVTKGFTTRDEIMSSLGLMDENYNYTDTYTNYINNGGSPLPGYEYAHQELLNQERYDAIFQQVEDGTMSYDTALMEAYGKDILATMGYDVTSVAYWKNKFLNDDFSNPFANQYLMDQVKQAAEEYHQARLAGEYGRSSVKDTQVGSYLGDELSASQIKDIFGDIGKFAEDQALSDQDLLRMIHSGQIGATSRMYQTEDGTYYYLHQDGELYVLDNQSGDHHGTYQLDNEGKLKFISLNGSGLIDIADHFAASFSQAFIGIPKLITLVTAIPEALLNGSESYVDALTRQMSSIDEFVNTTPIFDIALVDTVDLDGFQWEAQDILLAASDIAGMLVGSKAMMAVGQGVSSLGTAIAGADTLAEAQALERTGRYVIGKGLYKLGSIGARSTGLYEGFENSSTFNMLGLKVTGHMAPMLNHALKTVPTYAFKDFQSTLQQLNAINIQSMMTTGERAFDDNTMLGRAATITAINWGISAVLAGGVDDDQLGRLKTTFSKASVYDEVSQAIHDEAFLKVQNEAIKNITNEELKKFVSNRIWHASFNTLADFLDNVLTTNIQSIMTQTKTTNGKVDFASLSEVMGGYENTDANGNVTKQEGFFANPETWKSFVQAAVMTYPTAKKQFEGIGYNFMFNTLRQGHSNFLKDLDLKIAKLSGEDAESVKLVKQLYINTFNSTNGTMEQKILTAMSEVCDNLQDVPETLKGALERSALEKKTAFYYDLYKKNKEKIDMQNEAYERFHKDAATQKGFIKKLVHKKWDSVTDTLRTGISEKGKKLLDVNIIQSQNPGKLKTKSLYDTFNKVTDSTKAAQLMEKVELPEEAYDFEEAINVKQFTTITDDDVIKACRERLGDNADSYVIYELRQEAGYDSSSESFNSRMKNKVFKTTMDILSSDENNTLIVKIDENHYAMNELNSGISQAFTFDTAVRINSGLFLLKSHNVADGTALILSSILGDTGMKTLGSQDKYTVISSVLDKAIENGVLTELEAAHALRTIANSSDFTTTEAREVQKVILDRINSIQPNSDGYQSASNLEKKYLLIESLMTIKEFQGSKNKIIKDKAFNDSINLIIDPETQDIREDASNLIILLKETGQWKDNEIASFFDNLKKRGDGKILPEARDTLNKVLSDGAIPEEIVKSEKVIKKVLIPEIEEQEKKTKQRRQETAGAIENDLKVLDDYDNKTTTHKVEGKKVIIDLTKYFGDKTYDAIKDIKARMQAKQKGEFVDLKNQYPGLTEEFNLRSNLIQDAGKPLLVFNIDDPMDLENFIMYAQKLNMFDADTRLETTADVENALINRLKKSFADAVTFNRGSKKYIKLTDKDIAKALSKPNLDKLEYKIRTAGSKGELEDFDMDLELAKNIHINKVSNKVQRKRKGIISILPFGTDNLGEENVQENIDTGKKRTKQGVTASQATQQEEYNGITTTATKVNVDHDTGMYFYIRNIITEITDNPSDYEFTIYCKTKNGCATMMNALENKGIAGDKAFYSMENPTGTNKIVLTLKPNQAGAMVEYLDTSSDFNMFKILPLISKEFIKDPKNYYMFSNTNGKITYQDNEYQLPDMYNGDTSMHNTGIDNAQNITASYDKNYTLKTELFGGMAKSNEESYKTNDYTFDPFNGNKKVLKPKEGKTYTETVKDIQDSFNYSEKSSYDSYESTYFNRILDMEAAEIDNENNDDHLILLQDPKILKMLKEAKANGTLDSPELKDQIAQEYINYVRAYNKEYIAPTEITYSNSVPYTVTASTDDSLYYTGNILKAASGSDYIIDVEDALYIETLAQKAIDTYKTIKPENLRTKIIQPQSMTFFEEDDVLTILKGAMGNDGYLPIEDCERIANLTDDQLNRLYEAYEHKISINQFEKIRDNAKSLLENMIKLDATSKTNTVTEFHQYVDVNKPHLKLDKTNLTTTDTISDNALKLLIDNENQKEASDRITSLRDAAVNSINNKYSYMTNTINNMTQEVADQISERQVDPSNAEILNMENIFSRDQAYEIVAKTVDSIKNSFNVEDDIAIKIANDMYYSAMENTKNKEWQQVKVYNAKGEEVLDTTFSGNNYFEIYSSLKDLNPKEDLYFVQLNRHPLDDYSPIEFKYTKLDDNNIKDIKDYYLFNFIEQGRYSKDFRDLSEEEYYNKLQVLAETDPEGLGRMFESIINFNISNNTKKKITANNIKEALDNYYTNDEIRTIIIPQILGKKVYNNEGINNYLNSKKNSLNSENYFERTQAEAATYGITETLLTGEKEVVHNKLVDKILDNISIEDPEQRVSFLADVKKLSRTIFGSDEYNKQKRHILDTYDNINTLDLSLAYIAYSKNGEALSYKTNAVSMIDMEENQDKIFDITLNQDGNKFKLSELRQYIKNASKEHPIVWYDIEGLIPKIGEVVETKTIQDAFQIALDIDYGTGEIVQKTYYILHDGYKDAKDFALKNQLNTNEYYKTSDGYRSAVDEYMSGKSATAEFITEKQLQGILESYSNGLFIAYNGENYDFPISKSIAPNLKYFDAKELDAALYSGNSIDRKRLENLMKAEIYNSFDKTHDASADTSSLRQWAVDRINSLIDPAIEAKTRMKTIVDDLVNTFGGNREEIIPQLDAIIKSIGTEEEVDKYFPQEMVDASTTTYILRQFNNLREEKIGYAIRNFINNNDLYSATGFTALKENIRSNRIYNIIDLVAEEMVNNPTITASKALNNLLYNEVEEPTIKGYVDRMNELCNKEVSIDKSNEEFQAIRSQIIDAAKNKRFGEKFSLETKDNYNNSKKNANYQKYSLVGIKFAEELGIENEDLNKFILGEFSKPLSSKKEGLEQFNQPYQFVINTKTADKVKTAMGEEYKDIKGLLTLYRQGQWNKVFPITKEGNTNLQELKYNPTTKKLEPTNSYITDVKANDLVLDRKALYNLSRYDLSTIFDDEGNGTVQVLRQPSAYKGSLHFYNVKVVEGEDGNVYCTPATWKTIYAGDYDGDAITTFVAEDDLSRALGRLQHKYLFTTHDMQEDLYTFTNDQAKLGANNDLIESLEIATYPEVIAESKKLDKLLKRGKEVSQDNLRSIIHKILLDNINKYNVDSDTVLTYIGLKEQNGRQYIHNYDLLLDPTSYSSQQAHAITADAASGRSNLADSIFGFYKQRYMTDTDIQDITEKSLQKIETSRTRMMSNLASNIQSITWEDNLVKEYFNIITNNISNNIKEFRIGSYTKAARKFIEDIDNISQEITLLPNIEDRAEAIILATTKIYNLSDDLIRENGTINREFDKAFKIHPSSDFETNLKVRQKFLNEYKQLHNKGAYITGSNPYETTVETSNILSDIVNSIDTNSKKKFVSSLDKELGATKVSVAVVLNEDLMGSEDAIFINSNTKAKAINEDIISIKTKTLVDEPLNKLLNETKNAVLSQEEISSMIEEDLRKIDELEDIQEKVGPEVHRLAEENIALYQILKKYKRNFLLSEEDINTLNKFNLNIEDYDDPNTDIISIIADRISENKKLKAPLLPKYSDKIQTYYNYLKVYNKLLKSNSEVVVLKQQDDTIYLATLEPLANRKIFALGKGMSMPARVAEGENFDIIMSANSLSRLEKLGFDAMYSSKRDGIHNITFDIGQGKQTKKAIIFDDVSLNALENYNVSREPGERKIDLMTILANSKDIAGLSTLGSTVIKHTDDGRVVTDNSSIVDAINSENANKDISWSDASASILIGRATAISNLIDKYNLWDLYNSDSETGIHSKADFEEAILYYNPTSQEFYDAVAACIDVLEKGTSRKLSDFFSEMTISQRAMFLEDIENLLTHYEQGSIINPEEVNLTTKSRSRSSVASASGKFVGRRYNPSQTNARSNKNVLSKQAFYVPWDKFFRALSGYFPNKQDILDGTANGIFFYNKIAATEQGDDFRPLREDFSVTISDRMANQVNMNDPKSGNRSVGDINIVDQNKGKVFKQNPNGTSIKEIQDSRGLGNIYNTLSKSFFDKQSVGRVSQSSHIAQFLIDYLSNSNTVDGLIEASNRNIAHDIILNAYQQKYNYDEDGATLTVSPEQRVNNYAGLTSKGKDFIDSEFNFYTINEVYNKADKSKFDINDIKNIKPLKSDDQELITAYNELARAFKNNSELTKNFTTEIDYSLKKTYDPSIQFTFGKDCTDVFEDSMWSRSGIKIHMKDKGDTIAVDTAGKNYMAAAAYIESMLNNDLTNLQKASRDISSQDFEDYCKYNILKAIEARDPDNLSLMATYCNTTLDSIDTTLKETFNRINASNPEFARYYDAHITNMINTSEIISKIYNEPFQNTFVFLCPFASNNKEVRYKQTYNVIHNVLNFNEFDPTAKKDAFQANMAFNFFESSRTMIREMSKMIAIDNMKQTLQDNNLISNVDITNKAIDFLSENFNVSKLYVKDLNDPTYLQIHEDIINVIDTYTDLDVPSIIKGSKNSVEQLQKLYSVLDTAASSALEALPEKYGKSLSDIHTAIENNPDRADINILNQTKNYIESKIYVAQRLLEISPYLMENASNFINSLYKNGYELCNEWGQRIARDSYIKPLTDSSFRYLRENLEIAMNNQSQEKFNQYLIEKALAGELYIGKQDLIHQLESKFYTHKTSGKLMTKFKEISRAAASFQMAMPLKMLPRLGRFTGFDYATGEIFVPGTAKYIPLAAKEITSAAYSKGATIKPGSNLYEYFMREGQPLGQTGKDPINFTDDINTNIAKITDILTQPLAVQNHLGRYAIWLAAKESFDNGDPSYGPAYHLKDQIDTLPTSSDKAQFVLDYVLGSPGGFPYLSQKTSGLMMYATFPMNLTRTFGAWGMSLGRLASEGYTSENSTQWMKMAVLPSVKMAALAYASTLFISAICEKYGIDEETEKKWIEEGASIDPIGTLIGGTPTFVYDSINPFYTVKEMFYNPIASEYNKTLGDKFLGLLNTNVLSKFNPAITIPSEILLKKDFYGSGLMDTSNSYTRYENAIRKLMGFFVGTGVATNIVDQYKMDAYDDKATFASSLKKGFSRGLASDLGNQKSWKKDISNYYSTINNIRNYYYATNGTMDFDAKQEDLVTTNYIYNSNSYAGQYDKDDFDRVNKMLKKMINNRVDATTLYAYITEEYNKGTSVATLRSALNNNSIIRKLNSVNKEEYYRTLSSKDLENLARAIEFEKQVYPLLQEFFPTKPKSSTYLPKRTKYYSKNNSTYYPKTYRPYYNNYYPNNSYNNKKVQYNKNKSAINRVSVNVSPQMAVWDQDYNEIKDLPRETWYGGGKN